MQKEKVLIVNIFGNTLWHLVADSDTMCALVLIILLTLSIFCWTILIYKLVVIQSHKREIRRALALLKSVKTLDGLLSVCAQLHSSFPGYVLSSGLSSLKSLLETKTHGGSVGMSKQEYQLLKQSVDEAVDHLIGVEESYSSIISASAAISPLLGLFGTVWGLIDAFMRISQKQNVDIATVAPGVAEALITTAAGLMVAIPALTMVYYLNAQVHHIESSLFKIADRFNWLVYQLFGSDYTSQAREQGTKEVVDVLDTAVGQQEEHEWHE